jgi:hypothetical protein
MPEVERDGEACDHRVPGAPAADGGVGDVAQRALGPAEQVPHDVAKLTCQAAVRVVHAQIAGER